MDTDIQYDLSEIDGFHFRLPRCPWCGIASPNLAQFASASSIFTFDGSERTEVWWTMFGCNSCGGMTMALTEGEHSSQSVTHFPRSKAISEHVPERVRDYLRQAQETVAQPSASILMTASAVDAMLKYRNLLDGSLDKRIKQAAEQHLITQDMAKWAHHIRLDANDQRHADLNEPMPETEDAQLCLDFAIALAEILFVLPARVTKGIKEAQAAE